MNTFDMNTEETKVAELLKPRYLVIAKCPHTNLQVGAILEKDSPHLFRFDPIPYPHLFQPLPWWSHRKIEEMPEYVKLKDGSRVYKLSDADERYDNGFMFDYKFTEHHVPFAQTVPATLLQYEQYSKTVNKK